MNAELDKVDLQLHHDSDYSPEIVTLNQVKEWKLRRMELRQNIINTINTNNIAIPMFHIILTYYERITDRSKIIKEHRFIKNQMDELFFRNHRNRPTKSSYFFFCERHKTYLSGSDGNTYYFFNRVKTRNEVLNTITNNVEYDVCDQEVVKGAYHSHILKSDIPDKALLKPSSKVRKLLLEVTGNEIIPESIDYSSLVELKKSLLKQVCRRSEIVGNSNASIKIVCSNDDYSYDGYYGWKGFIAYGTKKCYNTDMMIDVIDNDNSSIAIRANTKSIEQSSKYTLLPEEEN